MDSRVWQGGASGGRSARHRSSLRPFGRSTPRRVPKGGPFCRPTPRRAPKGGLFCRPTPRRGQNGGPFCTVPGCAAKKAACFAPLRAARRKRRPVLHRSGLRGENGGLFFTIPNCAVKKAVCFAPFRAARSKRRPVFHSSWVRGPKGGPFCTPPPRGAAVLGLHFGLTIKRSRIHHGNPIVYPANFAGVRRRPGKFCCGGRRRLGQIRGRPQTPSVGR